MTTHETTDFHLECKDHNKYSTYSSFTLPGILLSQGPKFGHIPNII